MTRHIIRRLIQAVPTIFGITIISYMIMASAPGGPVALLSFGSPENSDSVQQQMLARRLGVDDPWPIQYLSWLIGNDWMWWKWDNLGENETPEQYYRYGILRGDFGTSFKYKRPTLEMIGERLPATIELGISSLVVALMLGVPLGIMSAVWHNSFFDNATRILAVVGNAVPNFWFGIILVLIFGSFLETSWGFGGRCDRSANSRTGCGSVPVWERVEYMILPTIVLAYGGVAGYSRYMRTSMLETINSDYVRTARAKGLPQRAVWMRHAARNALIPLATFLGPAVVSILGGAVIVERIFSWPGLGLLFIDSINGRDYPLVMGAVLIGSLLTVIGYIISDILYAAFDPRIRF